MIDMFVGLFCHCHVVVKVINEGIQIVPDCFEEILFGYSGNELLVIYNVFWFQQQHWTALCVSAHSLTHRTVGGHSGRVFSGVFENEQSLIALPCSILLCFNYESPSRQHLLCVHDEFLFLPPDPVVLIWFWFSCILLSHLAFLFKKSSMFPGA